MKRIISVLITLLFSISCRQAGDDLAGSGSRTGNAVIKGQLINEDGTPSVNADVNFIPASLDPLSSGSQTQIVTVSTDANGYFGTEKALIGTYNILADNRSGKMIFKDSILLDGDTTLQPLNVKASGSLRIVFKLAAYHDPRNIEAIFWGTNYGSIPVSQSGLLYITNMASGRYPVRFKVSLEYDVIDTFITIKSGECTDMDTILLGTPEPLFTNHVIDTINEKITLNWTKRDTARVSGYYVNTSLESVFTTDTTITVDYTPAESIVVSIYLINKRGTSQHYPQTTAIFRCNYEPRPLFTAYSIDTTNHRITMSWTKRNPVRISGYKISTNCDETKTTDTTVTLNYYPNPSYPITVSLNILTIKGSVLYEPTTFSFRGTSLDSLK